MSLKDKLLITLAALLSVVLVLLICGFLIALINPGAAHAQAPGNLPRPRFEQLYWEDTSSSRIPQWQMWHDKETGQEIVCALGYSYHEQSVSCWPTGYAWGGTRQKERPKHVGIPPKHALP